MEKANGNGEAEPAEDEMIEKDADPLDTEVEDADLFLGEGDDEYESKSESKSDE